VRRNRLEDPIPFIDFPSFLFHLNALFSPLTIDAPTYNPFPAAYGIYRTILMWNCCWFEAVFFHWPQIRFSVTLHGSHISETDLFRQLSMYCLEKVDTRYELISPSIYRLSLPPFHLIGYSGIAWSISSIGEWSPLELQ
jgi:hypothetical protein